MRSLDRDIEILIRRGRKYFVFLGIFLILTILLSYGSFDTMGPLETLFDSIFKDNGNFIDFKNFAFPIGFLVIHFLPSFAISEILYRDNLNMGSYNIGKFHSKREYFANKFLAASLVNACIGFFFFSFLCLYVSLVGEKNSMLMVGFMRVGIFYTMENILLTNFTLLIALFTGFRLALFIYMANLALAMVTNIPFILGQGSLVMKQDFYGGLFSLGLNIGVVVIYAIVFCLLAYYLPKHYDYFGRKRW